MTMSPENIAKYGNNMLDRHFVVYYITPIDDNTTQLRSVNNDIYNIPTNKLSDIHAILHRRYPNKHHYLRYPNKHHDLQYTYLNANKNIFDIHSTSQQLNIIDISRYKEEKGHYILNTDNIAPIHTDNISIQQALDIMREQIHAESAFMRLHPNTTYSHTDCNGTIEPINGYNLYISYRVFNRKDTPDINVEIDVYGAQNYPIHHVHFSIHPNATHDINACITNACNNIIAHIHEHTADYFNEHDSQHYRIPMIRAAKNYFAQPNNSLYANIHQTIQNFQQHYTYYP